MLSILWSFVAFIIALGVLITVHEFGHFWVARRCGVRVERFSIGFGKALWQRRDKQGTEYVIALIPLGGDGIRLSTIKPSGSAPRLSPPAPLPILSSPCSPTGSCLFTAFRACVRSLAKL